MSRFPALSKNKRLMLMVVIPIAACITSSIIGIIIGQFNNLFYALIGDDYEAVSMMVSVILFILSFGLSFLVNQKIRKWYLQSNDQT